MAPRVFFLDPATARRLLADAGYPDPDGFPQITIIYNTSENHRMAMEVIQNMWKQNLGINVALMNMEWKVLLKTRAAKDYDVSRDGWIGDYLDPNTFMDLYTTTSGQNNTGWGNPRYDELVARAGTELVDRKRFRHFYEAEKILLEESPVVPLYTYTRPMMVNAKLGWMSWRVW